jgi:hypothetical protein
MVVRLLLTCALYTAATGCLTEFVSELPSVKKLKVFSVLVCYSVSGNACPSDGGRLGCGRMGGG